MKCLKPFFNFLFILLLFVTTVSYSQPLDNPLNKPDSIVLGFSTNTSLSSLSTYSSILSHIATCTYSADGFGSLTGRPPTEQIKLAKKKGIRPLALVNNGFDANTSKLILESERNSLALIDNIFFELKFYNYSGVNIDFEGIYPQDRSYFTAFIKALYTKLSPKGFTVTIDVPAKTFDDPLNWWSGAYDYSELAKYSDFIVLMAYDEHFSKGENGPIASYDWVKRSLNYALSVIPKSKLVLGLAAYGYDWSSTTSKAFGVNSMYSLASTYSTQVKFDTVSLTPYFEYTDKSLDKHKVWFENHESISYKLDLVNKLELAGVAIWKLGLEDENYLSVIKSKLKNEKKDTTYLVANLKLLQPKVESQSLASKSKKSKKTLVGLNMQEKKKKL